MTKRIKILFLAANPTNTTELQLGAEARNIEARLLRGTHRDSFELVSQWAVRIADLQEILLRHEPHIVHFSGHGNKSREIILEDDAGKAAIVNREALCGLFSLLKGRVRVVILNACYAADQAAGLAETIEYAVGMNDEISDAGALTFSTSFYQALAFGRSIRESFEIALNQMKLENLAESHIPELFVKVGVDDSVPFLSSGMDSITPKPGGPNEGQRVLEMTKRALEILEEQAAGYGKLHIPVHLKIELEEKRRELAELEGS